MDTEVLDASEAPQQEEVIMEKEAVSKAETPEESTEPEKPPAAAEEPEQLAVNGHDKEVVNFKETEEAVVTDTETPTMEKADGEASDLESMPVMEAPPEPDESSEMISDPVAVVPEPENDLEPSPLAESAPLPQPEKLAESIPAAEPEDQTSPEPVMLQQTVDTEPPVREEKAAEEVESKAEPQMMDREANESAKEVNKAMANPPSDEPEKKAAEIVEEEKNSSEKPEDTEKAAEIVEETKTPEKPADAETAKGDAAKVEDVKPTESKMETEPEKSETGVVKGAVAAPPETEAVDPQLTKAEPEKEEDTTPAPGSMSFNLLEQEQTKVLLRTSRTLIVLRGLPGSGKSFLAGAIADAYKDHCSIICADNHGIKPESPASCADGFKALDEAVVSCCTAGPTAPVLIVVDDTNHSLDRLARMGEVAKEHHLVAIFLQPKTPWSSDVAQLRQKSRRGLEEAQLEAMKGQLVEMTIPLYFGFFLLSSVQDKIRCTSMDFLKTLDTLEAFKKHLMDFTAKPDQEVDLEQYFKSKGTLHCTTKFCNYGKAEGAKEYAEKPAVREFYGSAYELSLTALFVTPRTVGAQVSLTQEQLQLWPDDTEKEAESTVPAAASLPLGSRAHVTLGCAEGVQAVQTGLDLLEILVLKQDDQKGEKVAEMELGQLTYYGEGRWLLNLREPICAPACFSSFYKRRESTKKEPEKKKTKKCTIL